MNLPQPDDYIDIHNHGATPCAGHFQVENLMTHENRIPDNEKGLTYSIGIHPWFLTPENFKQQIAIVAQYANHRNLIALGEAGFDRLKGPEAIIQKKAFREHVRIADEVSKPLFVHCVRAWDELLSENKNLKPSTPWIIHGFRGKKELALQLISKGMYISFWFDFVLRPESAKLLKNLPIDKIFLETDGSGVDIEKIYEKVASDLGIDIDQLKKQIFSNYKKCICND
jgi:TatD DNase family protein